MADPLPTDPEALAERIDQGQSVDWAALEAEGSMPESQIRAFRTLAKIRRLQGPRNDPGELPQLQSEFDILEEIGRGSHGRVFRALEKPLGREVALKILEPQPGPRSEDRQAFLKEAKMMASVRHPHIVTLHSIREWEGRLLLCMEFLQGRNLQDRVEAEGPLQPQAIARVGLALCLALEELHQRGLVHGDVKPANVMEDPVLGVKLLDFGIARWAGPAAVSDSRGTPMYMAPELLLDRASEVSPATDLYALGVLLYWLATQHYPFSADSLRELKGKVESGQFVPLRQRRSDFPDALESQVEACLASKPQQRPHSATAMAAALEDWLQNLGEQGPKQASPAWFQRFRGFHVSAVLLLLPLLLLALYEFSPFWNSSSSDNRAGAFSESNDSTALTPKPISFQFRFQLFETDDQGREKALSGQDPLRVGQFLCLRFHADRELYLYFINRDSGGHYYRLFPSLKPELIYWKQPLPALAIEAGGHRIPAAPEWDWRVTSATGSEIFYLLLSPQPFDAEVLNDLHLIPDPNLTEGMTASLRDLAEAAGHTPFRGVGGRRPGAGQAESLAETELPLREIVDRLEALAVPLRMGENSGQGEMVYRLEMQNPLAD
ncbi:MAG: DUF4384 domain-containing protein [Planctomycetota bacterium]|nr:MAG: DUF4384 domain-containing protein [Planctomycetota bacterium]